MMAVALTLYACRNEDLLQQEQAAQKRNNADFFKKAQGDGIAARGGVDYVAILKAYERAHPFLASIPDQDGMPVWSKMKIIEGEVKTSLMIPLSTDNFTMSSVVFALIDDKSASVINVNNITNEELKNVVFNNSYSIIERESLFTTFMIMDNYTFGNEVFTNIPKELFVGSKMGEKNNMLYFHSPAVKEDGIEIETSYSGKVQVVQDIVCAIVKHCTHHGTGPCDGCGECKTESCSQSTIFIYSHPNPETGTVFYGYGEGGGGGGVPLPIPDPDPCGMTKAFYRQAPGCNGNTIPPSPLDGPCEDAKPAIDKANEILHTTAGQNMDSLLKGKTQAPNEWAVSVDQKPDGSYETSTPSEGTPHSSSSPNPSPPNVKVGDGHSHAGASGKPSGGDLYKMLQLLLTNPNFKYRYVYGDYFGTPETYALVVNDATAAQDFLSQFPMNENYDAQTHMIKFGSKLGDEFYTAADYYSQGAADDSTNENYAANAVGMAYILEKFSAGISVAKVDANGNLKKIMANVENITIPNSGGATAEGVKIIKCP